MKIKMDVQSNLEKAIVNLKYQMIIQFCLFVSIVSFESHFAVQD